MVKKIDKMVLGSAFADKGADAVYDIEYQGILVIAHTGDSHTAAATSSAFHYKASFRCESGGENIVYLAWHTAHILSQVITLKFNFIFILKHPDYHICYRA